MKPAIIAALLLSSLAFAGDKTYQPGTLLDITHADSDRTVRNSYSGAVVSVTDREYDISVKVGDVTYVGSYWPRAKWSYEPTDLVINTQIKVRFAKNDMFLLRDNGKEIHTKIIKRIALAPVAP